MRPPRSYAAGGLGPVAANHRSRTNGLWPLAPAAPSVSWGNAPRSVTLDQRPQARLHRAAISRRLIESCFFPSARRSISAPIASPLASGRSRELHSPRKVGGLVRVARTLGVVGGLFSRFRKRLCRCSFARCDLSALARRRTAGLFRACTGLQVQVDQANLVRGGTWA